MRIDVGEVALEVEVSGNGPAVVLLHGFPDTGRLWVRQVGALVNAGFRTIVPDQRGYGGSDKPADVAAYSIPSLVDDVVRVLDHLDVERAHIVGHDWGAAIAWAMAGLMNERVEKLVALSVGHPSAFHTAGFEQLKKSWYMLLFQFPGIAERWLSNNDWAAFRAWARHPDADAVITELERSGSLTPGLNWYRANISPKSLLSPPREFPPVSVPTMGVWSSGHFALTEQQMSNSSKYVAGSWRYERLDGVGHWMQLESPDSVNSLLLDFLAQRSWNNQKSRSVCAYPAATRRF